MEDHSYVEWTIYKIFIQTFFGWLIQTKTQCSPQKGTSSIVLYIP